MSEERIMKKLRCKKCGEHYEAKYSNEALNKKFPFVQGDNSYKNVRNRSKFISHKRELKCPKCGSEKKISNKLLIQISRLRRIK